MEKYDENNIFAKIIRKEAPCKKIYEDETILCFENIRKEADVHWLIVPKGEYICFDDFMAKADPKNIVNFFQTIRQIAHEHGLDKKGYKLVTNNGASVGQSVFHFHIHLLSGENLMHL